MSLIKFADLGAFDLQAWDEALYAVRAKSIICFGAFWDQTAYAVDGLYSAAHPPLYIWLTALSMLIFGVNEFAVRFFSVLFSLGVIIITFYLGKKYFDKKTGFFASLFLTINPFYTFWSMQGQFDITLTFFFALSFYSYLRTLKKDTLTNQIITGLFIGLALMTKLFMGGVIFIIILVFEILNKHILSFKRLAVILIACLITALPWHIFMIIQHSNFDILFFFKQSQMLERTFSGIENNAKELSVFFYLNQLIVIFPFLILPAAYYIYKNRKNLFSGIFVLWFITYFLLITIVSTKLLVYLLPLLIPFCLISVNSIIDYFRKPRKKINLFTVLSIINVLICWSLSNGFRVSIKNMFKSFSIIPLQAIINDYWWIALFFIAIEIVVILILYRPEIKNHAELVLWMCAISYTAFYIFDTVNNTYKNYDSGIRNVISIVNKNPGKNVIAVGHGINPQLSYYSDGLDIGWISKRNFLRLDPERNKNEIYDYLFSNEFKNTYIIYEKSDFYLRNISSPGLLIPPKYYNILETKEYILYSTER